LLAKQLVDAVDGCGEQLADDAVTLAPARLLLRDLEHGLLGVVEDLLAAAPLRVEDGLADLRGGADELTQDGALADDVDVGADIAGAWGVLDERRQIRQAAGLLEAAVVLQPLRDGDDVEGLALRVQRRDGLEDQAVIVAVEVLGA